MSQGYMFDLPSFTWLFAKDTAKLSKGSAWSFTPDSERTQGYRFSSANQLMTTLIVARVSSKRVITEIVARRASERNDSCLG